MEEVVRKSRKDKYMANQKIEIGQTSVERPQLIAAITIEVEETDDKSMPLQIFKNVKRVLSRLQQRRKKFEV